MLLFALFAGLLIAADPPKPIPTDPPKPIPIDPALRVQMRLLEAQAENLRLVVCSEAGIRHNECVVDWQTGTVKKADPPAKPQLP